MDIILNEIEWAENAISERTLGQRPTETLGRVAKYYIYHQHMSKSAARAELENFLLLCDRSASTVVWGKTIDRALRYAAKYPPAVIDKICITEAELNTVDSLESTQLKRIAFTILCVAKYMHAVNNEIDYWVNTPDKDIMRMANVNTSIKRQSLMYGRLRELGMIKFSKRVDNLSIQVLFVSDDSPVAMEIRDFRNLGYRYMMRNDKRYYECENCGIVCKERDDKTRGRKRKYCDACAVKVKTRQSVNSVMNRRRYINGKDNPYVVYMHVFPDGKKYIGMTSQPLTRRWSNGRGYDSQSEISMAIASYGWDSVEHYLLFDNLTKEQARQKWEEAVCLYRTYMPEYGYNRGAGTQEDEDFTSKSVNHGIIDVTPIRLNNHGRIAV